MKTYEATLYNKDVREAQKEGNLHPQFDAGWADQRYVQIKAQDLAEARHKIATRHPAKKGFVIVDVVELPDFS